MKRNNFGENISKKERYAVYLTVLLSASLAIFVFLHSIGVVTRRTEDIIGGVAMISSLVFLLLFPLFGLHSLSKKMERNSGVHRNIDTKSDVLITAMVLVVAVATQLFFFGSIEDVIASAILFAVLFYIGLINHFTQKLAYYSKDIEVRFISFVILSMFGVLGLLAISAIREVEGIFNAPYVLFTIAAIAIMVFAPRTPSNVHEPLQPEEDEGIEN